MFRKIVVEKPVGAVRRTRVVMSCEDLDLRQLRLFIAVVESEGFSRGAAALGLSQSTVSEALASLEHSLGTPVLRREGHRTVPTPAGEVLLAYARKIVALAAEATAKTKAMASRPATSPLVIGAPDSIASYLLPEPLARLGATRPHARAIVKTGACHEIETWLKNEEIELALVIKPTKPRSTGHPVLGHSALVLCGRSSGVPVTMDDLGGLTVYMSEEAGLYQTAVRTWLRSAGVPPPPLHAAGSTEGVKRAVLASAGAVGIVPAFAVSAEIASGALRITSLDPPLPTLYIEAIHSGATPHRPLVRELLALVRGALDAQQQSAGPERRESRSR